MKAETMAFTPGVTPGDAVAAHWLGQATLRLRREVCWLWRERSAQGLCADAVVRDAGNALPPFADPALAALDLARYADAKRAFFAQDATAAHLTARLASAAPAGLQAARGSLAWVLQELALSPTESLLLALALLPAVDSAAAPVIACCLNEPGRGEPTLALLQRLTDEPAAVLDCFDPEHPLVRHGLLAQVPAGWNTPLQMPALVARELLQPAGQRQAAQPSRAALPARRRLVPILGAASAEAECAAQQLAAQAGLGWMSIAPGAKAAGGEHLRTLMTLAWLRGAALFMPASVVVASVDGHDHGPTPLPLAGLPLTIFMACADRAVVQRLGEPALPALQIAAASTADRLAAWQTAVPSAAQDPLLAELARRLRCELSAIARIGAELALLGRPPSADELLAATRADLDLGSLAQAVPPRFGLSELMLPPAQTRQLGELVTAMNNLARVHQQWGTAQAWNESGLAALFAGPPGTGKTMASEAIAHELRLPLYRIDLSQVVNKYIGETEKNLKRLFDAADAAEVVLFFDEADALFGKRSEVKDAHDRYANLEISYLLERMERFKGLAILATNRRKDLDEAFLRRLRFVVEFPLPGVAERERIWRSVIPPAVDASDLDFTFLAQRFPLAGGHIRAIIFQACLQSAGPGAPRRLEMQAVIRAVQREYDKLERASSLNQFGPYAPLVAAERVAR
jgi:hypothetical protein